MARNQHAFSFAAERPPAVVPEREQAADRKLEPTLMAYFAGLIDGEGSIGIKTRRESYSGGVPGGKRCEYHILEVSVTNNCRVPLDLLRETFGGQVYTRKERYRGEAQTCYRYTATSKVAANILRATARYMIIKKDRALLGIEFADGIKAHGRRKVDPMETARRQRIREEIFTLTAVYNRQIVTMRAKRAAKVAAERAA
jgi:hypothetical protein